jgi:hypothetical protein
MANPIYICRNKASGKYSIYIDDTVDGLGMYVTPDAKIVQSPHDIYDDEVEFSLENEETKKRISKDQLLKYSIYKKYRQEDQAAHAKRLFDNLTPYEQRKLLEELLGGEFTEELMNR